MTRDEKLTAWFDGDLEDEDLTAEDIAELDRRVLAAVAKKVLARQGVHSFPQHRTVQ